ncbi:hypothetical protein NL532_24175 [Mesorhizobium sp. C120A]|uniref:hypothetical protein n=1 Tax=unclassified Mesorhizobium TaxID=325217 RepID=UPI000417F279|nr:MULTISPECIES: hypothetical protein [unclassified Mesorhizobium]WJI43707.1 hypothetical protein NL532_24175 [Mesorhizobium sp. C120A]
MQSVDISVADLLATACRVATAAEAAALKAEQAKAAGACDWQPAHTASLKARAARAVADAIAEICAEETNG